LSACPTGWIAADGTGGTPDLRGYFIQIVNTGPGGTFQPSTYLSHSHSMTGTYVTGLSFTSQYFNGGGTARATGTNTSGMTGSVTGVPVANISNTETRPRNIALLYCMKT
jgi:hypothetical protein